MLAENKKHITAEGGILANEPLVFIRCVRTLLLASRNINGPSLYVRVYCFRISSAVGNMPIET